MNCILSLLYANVAQLANEGKNGGFKILVRMGPQANVNVMIRSDELMTHGRCEWRRWHQPQRCNWLDS
ncbi:hypothetical protein BLOT_009742 [Blomia tropicalis]|nr:hypothetical protein BLOT_009742 [Blomia tropicalis]